MRIRRVILALPVLTLTAALGGCGWMSVSGPAATDILAGQRDPMSLNYAVVKVTPKVIGVLSKNLPRLAAFAPRPDAADEDMLAVAMLAEMVLVVLLIIVATLFLTHWFARPFSHRRRR